MPVVFGDNATLKFIQKANEDDEESSQSVRYDEKGHWPYQDQKHSATCCKLPTCKGFTHVFCEKCGKYLCFTRGRNCFVAYHKKN